uniref:Glycosyltransferase family 1 protein n=1 Tax=candidate division WOR-3 bacterium TaxID=2052148 RepID=A0A7C2P0G2_UNCW3
MNKLAWVIPSFKTGVGKYTETIQGVLSQFVDLRIYITKENFNVDELAKFSTIVYHLGNSRENVMSYMAIKKYPGIIVLHDRTYHNFFAHYYFDYLKKPNLYYKALSILYGEPVTQYAKRENELGRFIWETEDCIKYPMRELIYPYATAIVVHSMNYLEIVRNEYKGVIIYLPLPFEANFLGLNRKITRKNLKLPEDKIIMYSYGFMSKNRMIEDVLRIIGEEDEIRNKIFYVIAGEMPYTYLNEIKSVVSNYKLNNIRICGFLSDKELYEYLSVADLCVNLRRYNAEGASWSVLEQMSYGKAVLVMDNGFFSELPDDVLLKIKNTKELKEKLFKIIQNPAILKEIGIKAKDYVIKNFDPRFFTEGFLFLLKNFYIHMNKKIFLNKLLREIIEITSWVPEKINNKILSETAKEIFEVFGRALENENIN